MQVRSKKRQSCFWKLARQKCFFTYLPTYSTVYQNIHLLFLKKISQTHRHKQKSKRNYEEKRHTKETKEEKEKKNVVAVNSICRKSNDTSEFAVKVVFHLQIFLQESTFFLFKQQKVGRFIFQQRKVLLDQFLKRKLF